MIKKVFSVLGVVGLIGALTIVDAQARWGCLATASTAWGRNWGYDTRAEAEQHALESCRSERKPGYPACRVVVCNPNVDTRDDAHQAFPETGCHNCE